MTVVGELLLWLLVTTLMKDSQGIKNSEAFIKDNEDNVGGNPSDGSENPFLIGPLYDRLLKNSMFKDNLESKRQFDPWGGRRRHISNLAMSNGKRQFSPWGGKGGVTYDVFNSDADDVEQNPLLLSQDKEQNPLSMKYSDNKRSRSKNYSSVRKNLWDGKRSFNSWGGKRGFHSWGGKRNFNSWGGKRLVEGKNLKIYSST